MQFSSLVIFRDLVVFNQQKKIRSMLFGCPFQNVRVLIYLQLNRGSRRALAHPGGCDKKTHSASKRSRYSTFRENSRAGYSDGLSETPFYIQKKHHAENQHEIRTTN